MYIHIHVHVHVTYMRERVYVNVIEWIIQEGLTCSWKA